MNREKNVSRLPATPMLPAVAVEPATAMLPAVAVEPATAMLPAVAIEPVTPMLPAVATDPATAMLPAVASEAATAMFSTSGEKSVETTASGWVSGISVVTRSACHCACAPRACNCFVVDVALIQPARR